MTETFAIIVIGLLAATIVGLATVIWLIVRSISEASVKRDHALLSQQQQLVDTVVLPTDQQIERMRGGEPDGPSSLLIPPADPHMAYASRDATSMD